MESDDLEIDNKNNISVEEFEEEDNDYIDDGLIDNEELENLEKHFEFQIVRDVPENFEGQEDNFDVEMVQQDYHKEYENFQTDGEIYSLAINEKGIAVLGDGEDTIYYYDLNKKEIIRKEKIYKDSVIKVSFSNDGKYLAAASLDGTVNIFETQEFRIVNTMYGSYSDINWLEWHPKGPVIGFGCADSSVWVYHASNSEIVMSFYGHLQSISCGLFTADGKYLISGSDDTTVKVWDLKNQVLLHTLKGKKFHQASISSIAVAKKKNTVVTGSVENELAIANYENGNILHLYPGGSKEFSIESIEFCNEDKFVIFAGTENLIQIFDLSTLQIRIKISLDKESITKIVPSKFNNYLLYMSTSEGNFLVFDVRGNGEITQKSKVHSDVLIDFSLTKEENFVITSSLDKTINLVKIDKIDII